MRIPKISDMGLSGWLLRIVMAFLKDKKNAGKESTIKSVPWGGPQGTVLALLLVIVLINDIAFEGQLNDAGEFPPVRKIWLLLKKFIWNMWNIYTP